MDRDRYKKKVEPTPQKRSINGEEKPFVVKPTTLPNISVPQLKPVVPTVHSPKPTPTSNVKPAQKPPKKPIDPAKPLLFDDDDEDIFGVWKKQQDIKKARKAKDAAAKAAKKAAKLAKKQQKAAAKKSGDPREIAISVKVPRFSKIKARFKKSYNKEHKKYYIAGAILLLLPVISISAGLILQNTSDNSGKKTDVLGQKTVAAKPDFKTLRPNTTDNQATEIGFDAEKRVASYNDIINNVPVTVSQQPLPSNFQGSPTTEVKNLAEQISATEKISTSDVTAYAGVSAKGPQTVVFTKNDLLIFIFAEKKIDVLTWTKYIESMR